MNTITRQWCRFTGWPANCWELYDNNPYFGAYTYIGKAWSTMADAGQNIESYCLQAFNYFSRPGVQKRFTMMRPTFQSSGEPTAQANMNTDFNEDDTTATLSFSPPATVLWDTALWDAITSLWGGAQAVFREWQGTTGVGYCGAPQLTVASSEITVYWMSTDVVYEEGAIL